MLLSYRFGAPCFSESVLEGQLLKALSVKQLSVSFPPSFEGINSIVMLTWTSMTSPSFWTYSESHIFIECSCTTPTFLLFLLYPYPFTFQEGFTGH